ncbi:hypothetical protein F7Q91_22835 [Vibrio chagasii]|uniref:Uncharacterized protein n=1 Tax=Vibrio chagasii TaxID=170679 RepID=A0A7V7TEH3_9VIBR|nr:hypothetical protein [Vibrio chagasii]KAB0468683.1 hypothetical protein F7Q91_22835 [Vibrio chagasii]
MKKLIFFFTYLIATTTFAQDVIRDNLTISKWHPSSSARLHAPEYNGLTRVYFTEKGPWGSTSCRNDAADIRSEDTHILSAMLAAFMANKTVSIEVNSDLPVVNNVCKMTAAFINN